MHTQQSPDGNIRVIAAVVDTAKLTLYQESGDTIEIPQGDPRVARIISEVTPVLAVGRGAVATVSLYDRGSNPYYDYEQKSSGLVRFFKVARSKLTSLLGGTNGQHSPAPSEPVAPTSLGSIPVLAVGQYPEEAQPTRPAALPAPGDEAQRLLAATAEILAHAVPVSSPNFSDHDAQPNGPSTMVAVVGNQVVADIERLKPQIAHAAKTHTRGMDAFMKRLAAVSGQRRHSVEDLLKFLEKGDLPIADDGCIVIYKVLRFEKNERTGEKTGRYVDCHTEKVSQKVGSYVFMSPSLVDPDRRNECSNGLHVARRQYIHGFGGDVCVLAKVRPEDVIAVPDYDANKMRVCGYHILFELSQDDYAKLRANTPFTTTAEAQLLLGRALSGNHEPYNELVEITGHMGKGVMITPLGSKTERLSALTLVQSEDSPQKEEVKATALEPEKEIIAPPVDPKAIAQQVTELKAEAETRSVKAQRLWKEFKASSDTTERRRLADELLNHKKAVKLGWHALGLPAEAEAELKASLG